MAINPPDDIRTSTPAHGSRKIVTAWFVDMMDSAALANELDPRELRTSFVSLMSHQGVSIEEIARLVGHATTRTTEIVYRRELRPVITKGAEIMDELFTGT